MALLFLVYAKLWDNSVLLSVYLTLLLLSVVVFHRLRSHQWFSKHLIYRVLAETMRIKFFLRAAGADRLVSADGADQSHRHRSVPRLQLDRQSAEERRVARLRARTTTMRRNARACRACIVIGSSVSRNTFAGACARSSAITTDWKC